MHSLLSCNFKSLLFTTSLDFSSFDAPVVFFIPFIKEHHSSSCVYPKNRREHVTEINTASCIITDISSRPPSIVPINQAALLLHWAICQFSFPSGRHWFPAGLTGQNGKCLAAVSPIKSRKVPDFNKVLDTFLNKWEVYYSLCGQLIKATDPQRTGGDSWTGAVVSEVFKDFPFPLNYNSSSTFSGESAQSHVNKRLIYIILVWSYYY